MTAVVDGSVGDVDVDLGAVIVKSTRIDCVVAPEPETTIVDE